tara:strand:+ start:6958 stop:7230 length:273 start_codon:yes stop_codon:yes gene_type:complete
MDDCEAMDMIDKLNEEFDVVNDENNILKAEVTELKLQISLLNMDTKVMNNLKETRVLEKADKIKDYYIIRDLKNEIISLKKENKAIRQKL